jgi:hypothetical protein
MKLLVWTRDEGVLDGDFRDGDIFQVHPDEWEPGTKETQRWLVVQMADEGLSHDELMASEYATGPGNDPVVRRMRKYRLDYAPKLSPEELEAAKDRSADVPPIAGRFTVRDIVRK